MGKIPQNMGRGAINFIRSHPPAALAGLLFLVLPLFSGCHTMPAKGERKRPLSELSQRVAMPSESLAPSPAGREIPADLAAKIAQMLMVGFRGLEAGNDHFILRDIRERHLGGVILFDYDVPSGQARRNIESPAQLRALIASLRGTATYPLLIAIDQEGGIITRLKDRDGFPPTVSHQSLGRLNDPAETRRQSALLAETLAGLGINLNLAPVVDLCVNLQNPIIARYERCFSADPQAVTDQAREFIRAHRERGVLTALKHFPGHGSSAADSHLGLTDVTQTWSRAELEPYRQIIKAREADAIMTAHIFHAGLDQDWPATLSRKIIGGLLREELGYDGLVISDDLQMGAIVQHYGFETAIGKAIEAGVDILIFANNSLYEEDITSRAIAVIKGLVQSGVISEGQIDESYRRITRLKSRLLN
ncbi:MAG: glycoside hydrolase family 3 protein [Smithellaceae bacterium]|nr:glycoside hydrolase family 3 protein [Smithellaceae bacterium]